MLQKWKVIDGMVVVATISIDQGLEYAIVKLKTQIYMLRLYGNRSGMNNKTENLPQYQERLNKLLQIQKERRQK